VLVGTANADDAGVYRINDEVAVVLTADYFTPIVDDPYMFGAIAAANSLSDVWAMGARAVVALNIASFPGKEQFFPSLKKILEGGVDKMSEAGVSIIGGHTVKDNEPKFGYTVMGLVHPEKVLDNSMARAGDAMVLTKKIGTGIVSTGLKGELSGSDAEREVTESMAALNKRASEIMLGLGVSTATDITGFGLIGHLLEVLKASGLRARLRSGSVPYFAEAVRLSEEDIVPAGTVVNLKTFSPSVRFTDDVPDHEKMLLNDAQTSGGLLIFIPADGRDGLIEALMKEDIIAAHIGDVTDESISDDDRTLLVEP
jgi:selenide,water dikinase